MSDARTAPVEAHAFTNERGNARSEQIQIVYYTKEPGTPPGNWIFWARIGVIALCAIFWAVVIFLLVQHFMPAK